MATQLKHSDFTSTSALTPRPNIRVAFIAGEAATAVHDAMAKLPAETRDATLDDLVWDQGVAASLDVELIQSMTCSLIEKARELLSPRMYTAFLRWGETASYFSTVYENDEEGTARCQASADALRSLADVPAGNMHDVMFKTLLTGLEVADCPSFGPLKVEDAPTGHNVDALALGLVDDLSSLSPISTLFGDLSKRAWALSNSTSSFSTPIGNAITTAFSFARGEDDPARQGATGNTAGSAIAKAFATRRYEYENADNGPWTQEQEDAYFGRIDAADMVLLETPAATIEDAIAKLRVAFMQRVGTSWSDLAISNTSDPKFVEGLRMSDMYDRMAWGAIKDLAQISSVILAEQGR